MYGLINKSLKSMVIDNHGADVWQEIMDASGIPVDSFISMQRYDDAITYSLVGAAATVLDTPTESCLEQFGFYWATVTAPETYSILLDTTGSNLIDFLEHTNELHDRITSTFIGYIPPYFEVSRQDNRIALRYESKREGLTPFVIGVVKGLAERFNSTLVFDETQYIAVPEGETSVIHFSIA